MRWMTGAGVIGLASAAFVAGASADPTPARRPPAPAAKLFPFLDRYLKLPAADRTLFSPAYFIKRNGLPARDLKVTLLDGAAREPIPVGADGRLERLPTLGQLTSAMVQIDAPVGSKFSLSLKPAATLRPASTMSAAELARSIKQADAGMHKAAGLLALTLPKLERVVFTGGLGGQVVMSNGATAPLPGRAAPYADLTLLTKATSVTFTRPPSFLEIDEAPKPR